MLRYKQCSCKKKKLKAWCHSINCMYVVPQGNDSDAVEMTVIKCYEVKQANTKR